MNGKWLAGSRINVKCLRHMRFTITLRCIIPLWCQIDNKMKTSQSVSCIMRKKLEIIWPLFVRLIQYEDKNKISFPVVAQTWPVQFKFVEALHNLTFKSLVKNYFLDLQDHHDCSPRHYCRQQRLRLQQRLWREWRWHAVWEPTAALW